MMLLPRRMGDHPFIWGYFVPDMANVFTETLVIISKFR